MTKGTIKVSEDITRPFGHAILVVAAHPPATEAVHVTVMRRSAEAAYLGSTGWQARPTSIPFPLVERRPESFKVLLGPDVCDYIPVDLQVTIAIEESGVSGNIFWPPISPNPLKARAVFERSPTPEAKPQAVVPPADPEKVQSQPAPAHLLPPPPPVTLEPRRRGRGIGWAFALFLVVAALLGLLVLGIRREDDSTALAPGPSYAERFEQLRATDTDGDELYALSAEAYGAEDDEIGFRAIDLASQRGYADAKLQIASWYDPRTHDPTRFERPNANSAAFYYSGLAAAGNSKATDLLSGLCAASSNPAYIDSFEGFLHTDYCQGN